MFEMADEVDVSGVRVPTLAALSKSEQVWERMARKYGVASDMPPWRSSLDGMCEALDRSGAALPVVTRRRDEDQLAEDLYGQLPYPERQLVALAHSLVARGVIDEGALRQRMQIVRKRLES